MATPPGFLSLSHCHPFDPTVLDPSIYQEAREIDWTLMLESSGWDTSHPDPLVDGLSPEDISVWGVLWLSGQRMYSGELHREISRYSRMDIDMVNASLFLLADRQLIAGYAYAGLVYCWHCPGQLADGNPDWEVS